MARPHPDRLDLVPGEAVDCLVEDLPDDSSDEDDQGELALGGPRPQIGSSDEEYWSNDFGSTDEDWDSSDADSGYGSLSEEEEEEEDEEVEEREEKTEEEEEEVEDDDHFTRVWLELWRAPARAVESEGRPPTPSPQPRASCSPAAPRPPPVGPALDFIPLDGRKCCRDEDDEDEEDHSSKRPRLSSSNPGPSIFDPGPSTSSGTSGDFR